MAPGAHHRRTEPGTVRELRLGLVLYGGVSLAIYMHGVAKEINRLARVSALIREGGAPGDDGERAWADLLDGIAAADPDGVRTDVVVDAIAGTSAGGINGIFLAKALSHDLPQQALRDLWIGKGDISLLVRGRRWLPYRLRLVVGARAALREGPLRGDEMSVWLHQALQGMNRDGEGPGRLASLLPTEHTLELFVTMTDLRGYEREVGIASPKVVWDRQHRHVMTFRYRRLGDGQGRDRDDFGREDDASLAFAARATSSFPGAFPPITPEQLRGYLAASGADGSQVVGERFFRGHVLAGVDYGNTWFVDGGVLDNRPFGLAIDAIRRRPAETEVDRRLLYVDPDPPRPPAAPVPGATPEPEEIPVILAAMSLPRQDPILTDLLSVAALNERVARIHEVVQTNFTPIAVLIDQVMDTDPAEPGHEEARLDAWKEAVRALAGADTAGLSHASYVRLKIAGAVDRYAGIVCRVCDYPDESNHALLVRAALRCWAAGAGLFEQAATPTAAQREFLKSFDLGYGERLLRFMIAGVNPWYRCIGTAGYPSRAQLDALKGTLWARVQDIVAQSSGASLERDAAAREAIKARFPADEIRSFLQREGFAPELFVTGRGDGLDRLAALLGEFLEARLAGFSARIFTEVNELTLPWNLPERRRELLVRYLGYPLWDAVLYPLQSMADAGEGDNVEVVRVSPVDEDLLSAPPGRPKLGGTGMHHFGAFFDRAARENDYLWGRLDGAARLAEILVGERNDTWRTMAGRLAAAILAEEEAALPTTAPLVAHLRGQLG